jgi:ABC-type bacteriocin/lantibiotic exporter with double-glycine peptidase domain
MTIGAIMFHILLFNNVSAPIRQLHRIYDEVNDALIYSEGFTIKPNQISALAGLSGAWKSTVINLLDKFYEPADGNY